ncbi:MAG TPA: GNAT family N-acetyltransferase [Sphingobacteriaceae bacterium]|jgi:RimJ/RimL family protein N-acetyltransferase|nr:GNAT family N-acetyltransferase [Sphingobacteriaceae bacterium]
MSTIFDIQPWLQSTRVALEPLLEKDFNALYAIASDPLIWAQHPNPDRWQESVFRNFFEGAIKSKGAFKILDQVTGEIIGSTRIYDFDSKTNSILIGYTFFSRNYWGKGYNIEVKKLMLDYLFQFVSFVDFHIGAGNLRSQHSIVRLGARKVGELELAYYGEATRLNFVYRISKEEYKPN